MLVMLEAANVDVMIDGSPPTTGVPSVMITVSVAPDCETMMPSAPRP